jgi:hypothetical protein
MLSPNWFLKIILWKIVYFILQVFVIVMILLLILWELRLSYVQNIYSALYVFTQNNPQLFGVILGAFLASAFGLTMQLFLDRQRQNHSMRRSARILRSDIRNIFTKAISLQTTLQSIPFPTKEDRLRFHRSANFQMCWMPNWFDHVTELGGVLSEVDLSFIHGIYAGVQDYQANIAAGDISRATEAINKLLESDREKKLLDLGLPDFKELLADLSIISATGRSTDRFWNQFYRSIYFQFNYRTIKPLIEDVVVGVLTEREQMKLDALLDYMDKWLSKQESKFQRRYKGLWDQFVFWLVCHSDRISIAWNEVRLTHKADKDKSA